MELEQLGPWILVLEHLQEFLILSFPNLLFGNSLNEKVWEGKKSLSPIVLYFTQKVGARKILSSPPPGFSSAAAALVRRPSLHVCRRLHLFLFFQGTHIAGYCVQQANTHMSEHETQSKHAIHLPVLPSRPTMVGC